MQKSRFVIATFALATFIGGCDKFSDTPQLKKDLSDAKSALSQAAIDIKSAQDAISALNDRVVILEQKQVIDGWKGMAYLTPGSDGYSSVAFDLGYLTVALTDIKPYANGSKVNLKFGNTLSADINGLKATIEYGQVDDKQMPIKDSLKSKDITFSETLHKGAWSVNTVVLEGVKPTDLGFVRVRDVSHTGIELLNR